MESKSSKIKVSNNKLVITVSLTLIASILPDIIIREWTGAVPNWLPFLKLIILFGIGTFCTYLKDIKYLSKYIIVLSTIIFTEILTKFIESTSFWKGTFDTNLFVSNFGGSIILKLIGVILVIGVLVAIYKSPKEVYICKGDLSIKSDEINWLGINKDTISLGKLSVISGILISLGTILLTILTVTGISEYLKTDKLIIYFPIIVIFAIINSFCEGVIFRSAILGSLKNLLPKDQLILIAAMFFGIAHYYGAPSGIVGIVMSGVLGWYMCRGMYETKGFVSAWIIHFMQDVVIFSTILMLGNFN